MAPDALLYLADCFEPRAPGLAVVLRDWDIVIKSDPLKVAREALVTIAGANRLAKLVPLDVTHREAVDVLTCVFHAASRAVFARDAAARRTRGT